MLAEKKVTPFSYFLVFVLVLYLTGADWGQIVSTEYDVAIPQITKEIGERHPQAMLGDPMVGIAQRDVTVEVLLMRLQEIQAHLHGHTSAESRALSKSLFEISLAVRRTFNHSMAVSYDELTVAQQAMYVKIASLIVELDWIMQQGNAAQFPETQRERQAL